MIGCRAAELILHSFSLPIAAATVVVAELAVAKTSKSEDQKKCYHFPDRLKGTAEKEKYGN